MKYAADAIEKDNGYQADKARSNSIWAGVKEHWANKGIRTWQELLDGGTFRSHNSNMRLVWTRTLLDLLPKFADILHTDPVLARQALEKVLRHVHYKSELSLSLVAKILVSCGIKGYSQKAFEFRKALVEHGIIILKHRYGGYGDVRYGNFYYCAMDVNFQDEEIMCTGGATPVSIDNLSSDSPMFIALEADRRQLDCDQRYGARWRAILARLRQAA